MAKLEGIYGSKTDLGEPNGRTLIVWETHCRQTSMKSCRLKVDTTNTFESVVKGRVYLAPMEVIEWQT